MTNTTKSDISFYMSVHKDDPDQPDWLLFETELKEWMTKSGFKVYAVSNRTTPNYRIIEIGGTR